MERQREKERAQWVSLLDAALGREPVGAEEEIGRLRVTPFHPTGEAWEMMAAFGQEGRAVDTVEGVGEIDLNENKRTIVLVPPAPLPSDGHTNLAGHGDADPNLQRGEILASVLFIFGAKTFRRHSPQGFTHRDWPDVIVFLGERR